MPSALLMQYFLPLTVFSLVSAAAAADVDCTKLVADPNGYFSYQSVEVFPNPVQKTVIRLYRQTSPITKTLCGVTVKADSSKYSYQTKDIQSLASLLGSGLSWRYIVVGVKNTGGQVTYPEAATLNINLPDGLMNEKVRINGYFSGRYLPVGALMAVRIDGGKLLPLLFNGKFREIQVDPKMSKLELFIKSDQPVLWEKMELDVLNSRMSFFKKATFPAK